MRSLLLAQPWQAWVWNAKHQLTPGKRCMHYLILPPYSSYVSVKVNLMLTQINCKFEVQRTRVTRQNKTHPSKGSGVGLCQSCPSTPRWGTVWQRSEVLCLSSVVWTRYILGKAITCFKIFHAFLDNSNLLIPTHCSLPKASASPKHVNDYLSSGWPNTVMDSKGRNMLGSM